MLLILLAAALVSAVTNILSHESFTEVIIILLVVLLNAVLGVVQESKAEAAIEALQTMTAAPQGTAGRAAGDHGEPPAGTRRRGAAGGGRCRPGGRRILESASMKIEEAASPARRSPSQSLRSPSPGNRCRWATGRTWPTWAPRWSMAGAAGRPPHRMDTEMGKIAGVWPGRSRRRRRCKKLTQLGKTLSWLVLGICVFIFVFDLLVAGGLLPVRHPGKTFMVAVSLAVAAIPGAWPRW